MRRKAAPSSSQLNKEIMSSSSNLVQAYTNHPLGLCGRHDPAKSVESVEALEQRLSILTFGAVLDTSHLSRERWESLAGLHDHWLLDPTQAAYHSSAQILTCMQQLHIAGAKHTARVWWQICRGIQGRFKGSWRELLKANGDNAHDLQNYLLQSRTTFPVLAGPVISARWLDLVHRPGGVPLLEWDTLIVPLPAHQIEAARKFAIDGDAVHPVVSSALEVWIGSCQGSLSQACGLEECLCK